MKTSRRLACASLLVSCCGISSAGKVWCELSNSTVDEGFCQPQPKAQHWIEVGTTGPLGFTRYIDTESISKFGPLVKYTVKYTGVTDKFFGEREPKTIFAKCINKERAEAKTADLAYRWFVPSVTGSTDALEVDLACSLLSRAELTNGAERAKDVQERSPTLGNTVRLGQAVAAQTNEATPYWANTQSQLPPCQGGSPSRWNNCTGRWLNTNGDKYEGEWRDGKPSGFGVQTFASGEKYTGTWKDGKYEGEGTIAAANGAVISQGTWSANQLVRPANPAVAQISEAQRLENERKAAQLEQERVRLAQERERLDADKLQREKAKQTASIAIQASASQPDAFGEVTITIRTNTDTSSLKLNGDELGGKADGVYTAKRVARAGQETKFTVVARDLYGNTDTKVLTVSRPLSEAKESFAELNAANLRPQRGRDAVAIIIGIQDYLRVPKAEFAKDDAQAFYDYALRLGIKPENINMMLDSKADDVSILKAFKNWLPSRVTKDKTDVYVFFSGHGLPSDDGKLYLLPYGVDKDLLERTAVAQKEVVNLLQAARPKSVTMFIDSCYSGQTRGGEQLLASARPVSIMVSEKAYPDNFTVMSASASSQISSSSQDLGHGIFSYYLMKGLEGDADDNKDGTITIGKLQSYLSEKVPRFAMKMNRTQEPQLIGDSARVLVSR